MNEFEMYEYVVKEKPSANLRLRKFLLLGLYVLLAVAMLSLAVVSRLGAPVVALTPFVLALLVFFTWRYTSVELEYSITSGCMTVSKIFGGRSRRELVSFYLRECTMIAPATDSEWKARAEQFHADETVSILSAPGAPDAYFAAFETKDGRRGLVYFEATQKALRICHFYNASATTLTKVSL